MDDLISRSALKRFIQENGIVYANTLDKFPAVDAVEVVRCKDCKCFKENKDWRRHCCLFGAIVDGDDFCSYGERKSDDG